jgi:single-strand DNA-binding protein
MNLATFAGRIGRDAEIRFTQGGTAVAGFSLAVDERRGGEKTTLWVDCSVWGERAEKLAEYLTKGTSLAVAGQVGARAYEKGGEVHAVVTLKVQELTFMGGGAGGEGGGDRQPRGGGQRQQSRGGSSRPATTQEGRSTRGSAPAPRAPTNDQPFIDDDLDDVPF